MISDRPVFCRSSRALIEKCTCYRCVDVKKPLTMKRLQVVDKPDISVVRIAGRARL